MAEGSDGVLVPLDHVEALAGLLGVLAAVIRHYQPSEELFGVIRDDLGAGGWGHLVAEGNPNGVWRLLHEVIRMEGWLHTMGLGNHPTRDRIEAPPLPTKVAASFARWREAIYEEGDPPGAQ